MKLSANLLTLIGVFRLAIACSSGSPTHPPMLTTGGIDSMACRLGGGCMEGYYCLAGGDGGCPYLVCLNGAWQCPSAEGGRPDGGHSGD